LYASATYRSWPRRIGFLVASAVVPILANAVRAYGIIMLGHLSGNRIATGVDHVIYGGIFFSIVMLLLFALGSLWREPPVRSEPSASPAPELSAVVELESGLVGSTRPIALTAATAVVLVALAPLWARVVAGRVLTPAGILQVAAPPVTPPWRGLDAYVGGWTPRFSGADATVLESYAFGDQLAHFYLAYFAAEHRGAELISSENDIADRKRWNLTADGHTRITVDGRPVRVRSTILRSVNGVSRLVWTWYWIAGGLTSDPYEAKFLLAKARLLGGASGAAVVALSADCAFDCSGATAVLQDFLDHCGSIDATLRGFSTADGQP